MKFTGGKLHICFKPEKVKTKETIKESYDLSSPPALTEEKMDTLSQFCKLWNDKHPDSGIYMWVSKSYNNLDEISPGE